jgi:AhpC/TSA family
MRSVVAGKENDMRRGWWLFVLSATALYGQNTKTGLTVGQQVPAFSLLDQQGRTQTLKSVSGPKGTMLVFFRSADW